jgi:hypothetical protein
MTGAVTLRPDAPAEAEVAPQPALLFDAGGSSIPPGGLDFSQHDLSRWPYARTVWLGANPYSDDLLRRGLVVAIPGDGVSFTAWQVAALVWQLDHGGAISIAAQTDELIDVAAATIHLMTGGAGNA